MFDHDYCGRHHVDTYSGIQNKADIIFNQCVKYSLARDKTLREKISKGISILLINEAKILHRFIQEMEPF